MSKVVFPLYLFFSLLFLLYLSIPSYAFPKTPADSLQSAEPADTETAMRRAYFTNLGREEAVSFYREEMTKTFFGLNMPTLRLNYPPEEAGTIIRDQTRSSYLEEIAVPFRDSIFVNGFEPKEEKDAVIINDSVWRQKITVRMVSSPAWARFLTGLLVISVIPPILLSWKSAFLFSVNLYKEKNHA